MQFFSDLLQIYIIVKALKILFEPIQLWNRALLRPMPLKHQEKQRKLDYHE